MMKSKSNLEFMANVRRNEQRAREQGIGTEADVYISGLCNAKRPVIIVEGKRDQEIFGWIENVTREKKKYSQPLLVDPVDVAQNRPKLLSIYHQLKKRKSDAPVIFIADRDLYAFKDFPNPAYEEDIIWTTGYCIENDIYAGAALKALLEEEESKDYEEILDALNKWFAFGVEKHLDKNCKVKPPLTVDNLQDLVPPNQMDIAPKEKKYIRTGSPCPQFTKRLRADYSLKLPGKLLFQLLCRFTSCSGRAPSSPSS